MNGGVTGRPETMCLRTNVLRPLVHKLIVPCDTMSLDWCIPVILQYRVCNTLRLVQNDRDVSMLGHCVSRTIHLGDQGSQKIGTGTHCLGRPVTLPFVRICLPPLWQDGWQTQLRNHCCRSGSRSARIQNFFPTRIQIRIRNDLKGRKRIQSYH